MAGNSVSIKLPYASGRTHLNETLDIDELKAISDPIIKRAVAPIDEALEKAGLNKDDIDLILLAGGSSQLPGVAEKIKEKLGKEPCLIPKNLMLAISYGAALYQREIFNYPKEKVEVRRLGNSIGIKVDDGGKAGVKVLMNHDEVLPINNRKDTLQLSEGQEEVSINLVMLQGVSTNRISKRLKQRTLKLSKGAKELTVEYSVNENRIIELFAYDPKHPENKAELSVDSKILSETDVRNKQLDLGIEIISRTSTGQQQPCIGIDLGTTTSELTYVNRGGEIELGYLKNEESPTAGFAEYCFPSVVCFKDGTVRNPEVANEVAYSALNDDNMKDNVISNFKIMDRSRYVMKVGEKSLTVADLSAILLNKIWTVAQNTFKDMDLTTAVITVPAAFDADACLDTYNAAKAAGIQTVTLIDEPTAAFLYYKQIQKLDTSQYRNVLIFDFGGGTADISILDVHSELVGKDSGEKDCLYTVLSVSGDEHCGGKHVDDALLKEIKERFEHKNNCQLSATNENRLRKEIEKAKIQLSQAYNEE
jgi:molecular chaperone DnaK (HSP70)